MTPQAEVDRKFSVALINRSERKYREIRAITLPIDFATAFHSAIDDQIRGIPQPVQSLMEEIGRLAESNQDNEIDSMIEARCKI